MSSSQSGRQPGSARSQRFATTHWSLVVAARDRSAAEARQALGILCESYWYPLYAFIRRQGYSVEQAEDLTQEYFTRLLEKDFLEVVDQEKGKFRSFLLASCKHFLANQRDRARAKKRGGGRATLSVDFTVAEERYTREPAHSLTPERLFERRWALTLLDQVLARLREEAVSEQKEALFNRLKDLLMGERTKLPYAAVAQELDMSEGAVKVAVHRLRRRYRQLLRQEIARTLGDPSEVEAEIRDLFSILAS